MLPIVARTQLTAIPGLVRVVTKAKFPISQFNHVRIYAQPFDIRVTAKPTFPPNRYPLHSIFTFAVTAYIVSSSYTRKPHPTVAHIPPTRIRKICQHLATYDYLRRTNAPQHYPAEAKKYRKNHTCKSTCTYVRVRRRIHRVSTRNRNCNLENFARVKRSPKRQLRIYEPGARKSYRSSPNWNLTLTMKTE